jgi:hypothetical protein
MMKMIAHNVRLEKGLATEALQLTVMTKKMIVIYARQVNILEQDLAFARAAWQESIWKTIE